MMKAILILAGSYSSCISTQKIWHEMCAGYNIKLEVFDLNNEECQSHIEKFNLKSFPALIVNNKVVAVGHPSIQGAETLFGTLKLQTKVHE